MGDFPRSVKLSLELTTMGGYSAASCFDVLLKTLHVGGFLVQSLTEMPALAYATSDLSKYCMSFSENPCRVYVNDFRYIFI